MIAELGHFALALAVAFAVAQALLPLWGAHRRNVRLMQAAPALALGQAVALIVSFGNSLARLVGLPLSTFGTTLGHAGLGVTVAGIAGMSMAVQMVVLVRPGESVHLAGCDWTLEELHGAKGPNDDARVATIRVS